MKRVCLKEGINLRIGRCAGATALGQQALQDGGFDADALNPGAEVECLPHPERHVSPSIKIVDSDMLPLRKTASHRRP